MIALKCILVIMITLLYISHGFGCTSCGKKTTTPRRYNSHPVMMRKRPTTQDIINTYCKEGVNSCDLQNKGISSLFGAVFPSNITKLNLAKNNIASLQYTTLPPHLRYLNLDYNKLNPSIQTDAIDLTYLTHLHTLSLNYNKIRGFRFMYFPDSIKLLFLTGNTIQSFSYIDTIHRLHSLERLYLNKNQIESVIEPLWAILPASIISLSLSDNGLKRIQTIIPRNLQFLDLSNNPLQEYHISNNELVGCHINLQNTPLQIDPILQYIASLPRLIWNEKMIETVNCQICCEEISNGDNVMILPCLHKFHCSCVHKWLVEHKHQTCPDCRHDISVVE